MQSALQLTTYDAKTAQPRILTFSSGVDVLFIQTLPWAIYDGEIFYPDLASELTPSVMKLIHGWSVEGSSITRLPPEEWDFLLVSSMLRSLRPLLRPAKQEERVASMSFTEAEAKKLGIYQRPQEPAP